MALACITVERSAVVAALSLGDDTGGAVAAEKARRGAAVVVVEGSDPADF